jgi:hypothetical protein
MAAKTKPEVSKSEEVRNLLQANPQISAKEVIASLGKKGISVTDSLYYIVKGKMRLKKHRIAKAAASTNGTPANPVKKPASPDAPNKSQAIRDILAENPKISVEKAISTLAAKGIEVKKGLFYLVKGKMKSKKRRLAKEKVATEMVAAAAKKTVTTSSNGSSATDALTTIKQIKGLASELGGMKNLKALVEALSE